MFDPKILIQRTVNGLDMLLHANNRLGAGHAFDDDASGW